MAQETHSDDHVLCEETEGIVSTDIEAAGRKKRGREAYRSEAPSATKNAKDDQAARGGRKRDRIEGGRERGWKGGGTWYRREASLLAGEAGLGSQRRD
jgi:hypothetical protein